METKNVSMCRQLRNTAGLGGARRNRTADLMHAMQALYKLSYSPMEAATLRSLRGAVKDCAEGTRNLVKSSACRCPFHDQNDRLIKSSEHPFAANEGRNHIDNRYYRAARNCHPKRLSEPAQIDAVRLCVIGHSLTESIFCPTRQRLDTRTESLIGSRNTGRGCCLAALASISPKSR